MMLGDFRAGLGPARDSGAAPAVWAVRVVALGEGVAAVHRDVGGDRLRAAVQRYLKRALEAAEGLGVSGALVRGEGDAFVSIFAPKRGMPPPPRDGREGARGEWQTHVWGPEGRGYVAFPSGRDFLGDYELFPCGMLADIQVRPLEATAGAWRVDPGVPGFAVARVAPLAEAAEVPEELAAAVAGAAPHRLRYQAWGLRRFVDCYDPPPAGAAEPPIFPLERAWLQAVVADVRGGGLHADVGEAIVRDLVARGPRGVRPGSLLRGLPGLGKTALCKRIALAIGVELSEAGVERRCMAPLGHLVGGPYRGDVTAAFDAMFQRARGTPGLVLAIVDEADIAVRGAGAETGSEQLAQWLTRFTQEARPPTLHLLCTTNNADAFVGPVRSRFCGREYVLRPQRATELLAFCDTAPGRAFVTHARAAVAAERAAVARAADAAERATVAALAVERVALVALGLSSRALDSGVGDAAHHHRAMGNTLLCGSASDMTLADAASVVPGTGAAQLGDFLVQAAGAGGVLTGRMVVLAATAGDGAEHIVVDVEVAAQAADRGLGRHTLRAGPRGCRHYRVASVLEVYWALLQLARAVDACCLYSLTDAFLRGALGASAPAGDSDEARGRALGLVRDLCYALRDAPALLVTSAETLCVGAGRDATTARPAATAAFFGLQGVFCATPAGGPLKVSAVVCRTEAEVALVRQRGGVALSSGMQLALSCVSTPFPCARSAVCGKLTVERLDETGCAHTPLPGDAALMCTVRYRPLPGVLPPPAQLPPGLLQQNVRVAQVDLGRDGEFVRDVSCGCRVAGGGQLDYGCAASRQVPATAANRQTQLDGLHARTTCTLQTREQVLALAAAQRVKHLAESVRVRCACNKDIMQASADGDAACPLARHERPTLRRFAVPEADAAAAACAQCPAAGAGLYCCTYCNRLVGP